jgi:hypothetical protein
MQKGLSLAAYVTAQGTAEGVFKVVNRVFLFANTQLFCRHESRLFSPLSALARVLQS